MSKKSPVLFEVGIGVVLTLLILASQFRGGSPIESASLKTFDYLSRFAPPPTITDSVRIVAIDQQSVEQLGRWPWPRALTAQLIDQLVAAGAKVIGLNIFLPDPDRNQGLEEVQTLETRFSEILAEQKPILARKKINTDDFVEFLEGDIANAKANLDGDSILGQAIEQAVNVVLPMYFIPGQALGQVEPLPAYFERDRILITGDAPPMPEGQAASMPLEAFGSTALAVGHANIPTDEDGTIRRVPPVIRYGDGVYPSFPIQIVREFLKLQRGALKWSSPGGFELHKARLPTDESGEIFVRYAGPAGTIKSFSALDVFADGLPEGSLQDKVVLVGLTAPGAADGAVMVAPGGELITGLEIVANHIENILSQSFIERPLWARKVEWINMLLAALVVIGVLPLLRARIAVPVAATVFAGIMGSSWYLFVKKSYWINPAYAAALLVIGFVVMVSKRLLFTERRKELVEAESVETNKMLGLSFQGQGMLDIAFEKFRRCPLDDAMKELLYNLGLDMERKRMFTKAAAVYEHIAGVDPKYKDIAEKIELLKKAGEGAVFGPLGKKGSDATVVVEGLGQSTTLGRYEVIKELGRGAMGIVYLGRDPKINRQVAIKTLRFTEETDEEAIKTVKERFFREAESAGSLTHPNIIRIFDAGEDQDVAYIAMELLDGEDLKKFCERPNLLPLKRSLEIIIQVAFGLDYAHKQGVVHRDIKPGNIMILKDGTLRITDFGIARIQASSKTATGAVLGTPAYMSPEQVNGKKVDGRADIFSLGVTLFEMITGEKPFVAETIAALLYRIANVDHADPRSLNKKLPEGLTAIVNKALAKDPAHRYQSAGEFGADLRQIVKNLTPEQAELKPPEVTPDVEPIVAAPYTKAAGAGAPKKKRWDGLGPLGVPESAVRVPAEKKEDPAPPAGQPPAQPPEEPPASGETQRVEDLAAEPIDVAALLGLNEGEKPAVDVAAPASNEPVIESHLAPPAETGPVEAIPGLESHMAAPVDSKSPVAAEPGIESTQIADSHGTGETPARPEGFEATHLIENPANVGKVLTEKDFLSELENAFKPSETAGTPAATPEAEPKPAPFKIIQSNDLAENLGAEDAFLQALNQDEPPTEPPMPGETKDKKQA